MNEITAPITVLRMRQLRQKLSISRSSIYEKINPRSPRYDATFPKPIKLGAAAVGWVESEVDQWIMNGASVL
ncbi:AlpA family phage regulatory protein [Vreelandella populi]|uniref:AlpA family phage regulatory protein n=1 Tax=Vreelandella populi TaxID=2498858 RepID=A0A433L7R6_9GAMM|nr:AlpA family phage regulatory protein [Halomonas populi]RUR43431.1 AlpA family phage regulatory protein [Halomonas populi]